MAKLGFTFDASKVAQPTGFADLPDIPAMRRMRALRQWVCWRYEERNGGKPTKVPYQPGLGFKASTGNPSHWGSYEQAVSRAQRGNFDGIGFVLADGDDFTGIDLDHCRDPNTGDLNDLAQRVVDLRETYCEVTPSEAGLRLIVEGKIATALKRDAVGVEMYGRGRYLTITGWHLTGTPQTINPAERTIAALREAVAAHDASLVVEVPETVVPGAGLSLMPGRADGSGSPFFGNVNDAALSNLHAWVPAIFGPAAKFHPGTGAFRVSSKSLGRALQEDLSIAPNGIRDWGVGDMGDPREGGRTAIDIVLEYGFERDALSAARWLCQQMGKDPAAFGWEDGAAAAAAGGEIAAAILGKVREAIEQPDGTLADAETGEAIPAYVAGVGRQEMPEHLAHPPGMVGEFADWVCGTARRPQRALAIASALATIGTLAGRHIAGPTGSGTHLYVVGLAPTGAGKDHGLQSIMAALMDLDAPQFIGPSQFISMPAVINFLVRSPLSVCCMDEFGAFMKRINSRKASGFEGAISGILRTAWGTSFRPMATPEWAGRPGEIIATPALSIYGVSTAEEFYGSMEGADASNGVLNRLLVVETFSRPQDRAPALRDKRLTGSLEGGLRAILHRAGAMVYAQLSNSTQAPPVYSVPWGAGAEAAYIDMVEGIYQRCDDDAQAQAYYARAGEMAVRLATILAVGIDPHSPVVTLEAIQWGRDFALWSAACLERGGGDHIADTENQSMAALVRRVVRDKPGISHRDLLRRLQYKLKNRDLHEIIKALIEGEEIVSLRTVGVKGGRPSVHYHPTS